MIQIIVEENEEDFDLPNGVKAVLDERLQEDENEYLSGEASINRLKKKYAL